MEAAAEGRCGRHNAINDAGSSHNHDSCDTEASVIPGRPHHAAHSGTPQGFSPEGTRPCKTKKADPKTCQMWNNLSVNIKRRALREP